MYGKRDDCNDGANVQDPKLLYVYHTSNGIFVMFTQVFDVAADRVRQYFTDNVKKAKRHFIRKTLR